jgi:hypothetical protein
MATSAAEQTHITDRRFHSRKFYGMSLIQVNIAHGDGTTMERKRREAPPPRHAPRVNSPH